MSRFRLIVNSKKSNARTAILTTVHGTVRTPCFMPIATRGAVKTASSADVADLEAQVILGNTYHLWQRPGLPVIRKAGDLHNFMQWSGPILTDSGGYQVFSLAKNRTITERGVRFTSEIDGQQYLLTPEKAINIQQTLGSDIMMSLDECPPHSATRTYTQRSLELTNRWARRGLQAAGTKKKKNQLLFGIIQGSVYQDLRRQSATALTALPFDGFAVGGLAVGEAQAELYRVLDWTAPLLPPNRPRYAMGIGKPEQIVRAVTTGIDMFDCVLPTRNARHGVLYTFTKKPISIRPSFYRELRIKQSTYQHDMRPVAADCDCPLCKAYSRAYLRHLFMVREPLAARLATLHNIRFYMQLMQRIRSAIRTHSL